MDNRGDPAADRIYTTRLTPYRSMTPRAVKHFIIGFCCLNLVLSAPFFIMGAWPVVGFMGLDVLALYIAFKVNFRSADAYETVEVTALELVLAKVTGAVSARSGASTRPGCGSSRISTRNSARSGWRWFRAAKASKSALFGPEQKAALARDLARALADARRGPRFEQDCRRPSTRIRLLHNYAAQLVMRATSASMSPFRTTVSGATGSPRNALFMKLEKLD